MDNAPAASEYRKFPIDQIKSSRSQARQDFDEPSQVELTQSMKEEGLIQAITLRLLPDGSAELVSGERRFRAAKRLGWTEIDAKVYPALSDQEAAVKGLIENLQRKDLNPIEEARGFKQLSEPPYNLTQEKIAQRVGKDQTTVARVLSLLGLPDDLQVFMTRVINGEGHTRSLRKLSDPDQRKTITQQAESEGWSVKETEKRVNEALGKPSPNPLPKGRGPIAVYLPPLGESTRRADEGNPPDPLADFWAGAMSKNEYLAMNYANWGVSYGRHELRKTSSGQSIGLPAYSFWFAAVGLAPKADLKKYFQALLDLIGDTPEEENQTEKDLPAAAASAPSAPPPAPAPAPEPPKKVRDPKIQAMIDRQLAKGKLR